MEWIFLALLATILGVTIIFSYRYGISPTPTSKKVKRELFAMLPSLTKGSIAELGSGWGSLAFTLARSFPSCLVKGYEISPFPYLVSRLVMGWLAFPNLTIERQDFFQIPLDQFDLIVCYLYPGAMERLKVKFEDELQPDAYVISHTFAIPGWTPIRVERVNDLYHTPIYLYQVKSSFKKK